jgi:hypothetical protein
MLLGFAIWFANMLPYKNVWNRFNMEMELSTFFCENTTLANIVRQPINTFSNFIYLLAGMVILRRGWKDRKKKNRYNIVSANPYYSIIWGCILLYTFCASVFFHSSLIHVAGMLDFSAVYSMCLYPLMYFSHRVWLSKIGVPSNQKHPRSTRTLIAISTTLYIFLTFFSPELIRLYLVLALIILLVIFGIIVEIRDRGKANHYYLMASSGAIIIAVIWYIIDVKKILCNPMSVIQAHSMWHIFSGIAAFYFYIYIRSERNKI